MVGFEGPHPLMVSPLLNLHSQNDKRTIYRSPPPSKILGQKAKSNHLGDSNDQSIIIKAESHCEKANICERDL